eukprot:c5793_g1_i1.p1 GENE.c5793_g1_i1~~c5793_g1_i1.p1  ORF type:complete len:921 (+),score=314.13 c5793_g1_i1:42-2804(+)
MAVLAVLVVLSGLSGQENCTNPIHLSTGMSFGMCIPSQSSDFNHMLAIIVAPHLSVHPFDPASDVYGYELSLLKTVSGESLSIRETLNNMGWATAVAAFNILDSPFSRVSWVEQLSAHVADIVGIRAAFEYRHRDRFHPNPLKKAVVIGVGNFGGIFAVQIAEQHLRHIDGVLAISPPIGNPEWIGNFYGDVLTLTRHVFQKTAPIMDDPFSTLDLTPTLLSLEEGEELQPSTGVSDTVSQLTASLMGYLQSSQQIVADTKCPATCFSTSSPHSLPCVKILDTAQCCQFPACAACNECSITQPVQPVQPTQMIREGNNLLQVDENIDFPDVSKMTEQLQNLLPAHSGMKELIPAIDTQAVISKVQNTLSEASGKLNNMLPANAQESLSSFLPTANDFPDMGSKLPDFSGVSRYMHAISGKEIQKSIGDMMTTAAARMVPGTLRIPQDFKVFIGSSKEQSLSNQWKSLGESMGETMKQSMNKAMSMAGMKVPETTTASTPSAAEAVKESQPIPEKSAESAKPTETTTATEKSVEASKETEAVAESTKGSAVEHSKESAVEHSKELTAEKQQTAPTTEKTPETVNTKQETVSTAPTVEKVSNSPEQKKKSLIATHHKRTAKAKVQLIRGPDGHLYDSDGQRVDNDRSLPAISLLEIGPDHPVLAWTREIMHVPEIISSLLVAILDKEVCGVQYPLDTLRMMLTSLGVEVPERPKFDPDYVENAFFPLLFSALEYREGFTNLFGGWPFTNSLTMYKGTEDEAKLNQLIPRVMANTAAQQVQETVFATTAIPKIPLVLLFSDNDAVVPVWHVQEYLRRAGANHASRMIQSVVTHDVRHLTFTIDELALALGNLIDRISAIDESEHEFKGREWNGESSQNLERVILPDTSDLWIARATQELLSKQLVPSTESSTESSTKKSVQGQ